MRLKDFQILDKLGEGSFGLVFKAIKKDEGQLCVLKEVQMSMMDLQTKEWAMNEVNIMKNITCDYIVKYHLSFIENNKLYICMEYCSGGDLSQYIQSQKPKPLSEDSVWTFSLQIMLGLKALHLKKVLHRDIKTSNIFLTENRRIKIGDLGIAKTMTADFATTCIGTPLYLSPEMCQKKPYNEKNDVWALGCLIYELCTGSPPFEASNRAALQLKIVRGRYKPLPNYYSPLLTWLVKQCLSIDHKRRPTINYLLSQSNIIKKAKNLGIAIEEFEEIKQGHNNNRRQASKENCRLPVNQVGDLNLPLKRNSSKKQQKSLPKKDESKSYEKGKRSSSKNSKEVKKQQKGVKQVGANSPKLPKKDVPAKKNRVVSQINKNQQPKQREPLLQPPPKIVYQQVPKQHIKLRKTQTLSQKQPINQQPLQPHIQRKEISRHQKVLEDDELIHDDGITPQKIVGLQDNVQFKKPIPINWNCNEQLEDLPKQLQFSKAESRNRQDCQSGTVEMKLLEDDDDLMPQDINDDDNRPFKSQEADSNNSSNDDLLLDQLPSEIDEEDHLIKTQKIAKLQRKIHQNDKRRKELIELRNQGEKAILKKIDKSQLQKIRVIVSEGTDEQIQKIASKQLLQYYRIFHYSIEIRRCDETMQKCRQLINQIANNS